jgi:hypothetical protein
MEKLAWIKDPYLKTRTEYLKDLLNAQKDGKDNTENNRVPENGNTSDKVEKNMLDSEIAIRQKIINHQDIMTYLLT